jgi:hypothetical protein
MTELLVITLVLLVGILIGISFPMQVSLSDLAAYSGIVSGVIALVSFIIALKLYLKWKKPLDSADTKALIDSIIDISDSSRDCAVAILDCGDKASGTEYLRLRHRLINEISNSVVKVKSLEVVLRRSHVFYENRKLLLICSEIDEKLHELIGLSYRIHHLSVRQAFVDLNTGCMTDCFNFCEALIGKT